jgi:hypothetical protein
MKLLILTTYLSELILPLKVYINYFNIFLLTISYLLAQKCKTHNCLTSEATQPIAII